MRRIARALAPFGLALSLAALPAQAADLLVLTDDVPNGLDVDGPTVSTIQSYGAILNLMDPLLYFAKGEVNAEGVQLLDFNRYESRLAESWSYDPATFTWTIKLRRNVRGCDGATLNADDIVYTYARGKSVSGAAPIAWFLANVGGIDGFTPAVFGPDPGPKKLGDEVRKIDDHTVAIRQSGPNTQFERVQTIFALYIYDKESMERRATAADPWSHDYNNTVNAPGFGPWCMDSWAKGQEFRVRANPNYYRGKAAYDRVVLRKVPQSANRLAVLRTGGAQIAERLTPREYESLRNVRGVKLAGTYGNENVFLSLNFKSKPFDDPRVRRAVAYAIPYDRIIRDGYFGQARKWEGLIPSSYPGFHKAPSQYEYDPAKAKALLAEAGYPNGIGPQQFPDALKLSYMVEREGALGPVATTIQSALRESGITIQLDPLPGTQYGDRELVKRDMPMGLSDHVKPIGVDAAYGVLLSWVSPGKGGIMNSMNYENATVDNTYYEQAGIMDQSRRQALLTRIQDALMTDLPAVPLVENKTFWATSDKVQGITWHPDNALHWYDFRPAN